MLPLARSLRYDRPITYPDLLFYTQKPRRCFSTSDGAFILSILHDLAGGIYIFPLYLTDYRYFFNTSTLSVASQGRSTSVRPKCP